MKKRPPRLVKKAKVASPKSPNPAKSSAPAKIVSETLCPVVGVGASAGGLEAFIELLKSLPANTGFAFAFVQHLDPAHKSNLSEILARSTTMPVIEAGDGVRVRPNRVYVIPPDKSMTLSDGALAVKPRVESRGQHLPVDHLFNSLAAHRGSMAIGVVLSGTASDGTLGLKAIKAADGITFAQSEDSAKFTGMPRSAAASGCVDYVLPPEKIAKELTRLSAHPYVHANAPVAEAVQKGDSLRKIFKLLHITTGVDFANYRQTTIHRRIQRRVAVQRVEVEDYLKLLEKNPAEVHALFHDILIHVTNFFREPETFEALTKQVFPELLKNRRRDDPIRIWLPGCSTGEEAYSLAIALTEFLGQKAERVPVQIFGTDVSEPVIEAARKGLFDTGIEEDVSQERLRRFFTETDGGYRVAKPIRDLCVFARQNVVKDPPFSNLDLISCRNVLIYFDAALQKKLIPVFHYALKQPGYLLLGSAENISGFDNLFTTVDSKNKIFLKRTTAGTVLPHLHVNDDAAAAHEEPPEAGMPSPFGLWSRFDIHKEADRLLLAKFCPPAVVVDDTMEIIQFRGNMAPYLNPTPGEASLNLFKMIHPAFATALRSASLIARQSEKPGRRYPVHFTVGDEGREATVEVVRIQPAAMKEHSFVVLFEETPSLPAEKKTKNKKEIKNARICELEEELTAQKGQVQALIEDHEATNEELRSANEEIQSSNEELQSTNEELETAKEELQSTNEELTTLNEELRHSNADLRDLNDDLNNPLRSVSLPLVMLGRDLKIRRFTPAAQKFFKLIPGDLGRAITDIQIDIEVPDFTGMVREVIDNLCVRDMEVKDRQGRWHRLQVRPYETMENKIAGVVLILFDIDAARRRDDQLRHASSYAEALIETIPVPLMVLDGNLRVMRATSAFYTMFHTTPHVTEGRIVYEMSGGQWDIPALHTLLDGKLAATPRVDDFKIEHVFPKIGKKTLRLNARRVVATDDGEPLIVLSIADVRV